MQPLASAVIRRPFHWGIVIITDATTDQAIPDVDPDRLVTANRHGVIALLRHAQDITSFEDDFEWAEAEVLVRLLPSGAEPAKGRREVYRGLLITPTDKISIGDADGDVVHPAHQGRNLVVVSVSADMSVDDLHPDRVQVDLLPAD